MWAREGERSCEAAGSACSQVKIGDPLEQACQTRGQRAACLTHAFDRLALEEEPAGSGLSGRASVLLWSMYVRLTRAQREADGSDHRRHSLEVQTRGSTSQDLHLPSIYSGSPVPAPKDPCDLPPTTF